MLSPAEDALRELEPCLGIGVIRTDLHVRDFGDRHLDRFVAEKENVNRVLGILRHDQFGQRERDLLRRRDAILAVENHRMRDVDHHDGGATGVVLRFEHLEVLFDERDRILRIAAMLHRILQRAHRVERHRVIAELILPGFGQSLSPRPCRRHGVITCGRFLQTSENLIECVAANLPFAAGGEREISIRVLTDHVLLGQLRKELREVHVLVDEAAVLKHLHPTHRLFDVAACLEQQMIEEAAQPHLGEDLADEFGIEPGVTGSH